MDTSATNSNIVSSLWGSPQPISRALTPQPQVHVQYRRTSGPPSKPIPMSPASSSRPTPVSSPPPLPAETELAPKSMAGMSREEKAAEMAKRKEERRLRIERLKEQKKNVATTIR
ncbi:hypothetical protein BS17DRAFT_789014 [Gyrodon lividus]|nr:hypothetical protein BS17DRAFT_789014 [Gyrodon lividus]